MTGWLILFVGAIYLAIAIDLAAQAKLGLALTFLAYALANVGLWLAERGA